MLPSSSGIARGLNDYMLAGYLSKKGSVMGLWSQRYYVLTEDDLICYRKSTEVDLFALLRNSRETSLCRLRSITPMSSFVSCHISLTDPCTVVLRDTTRVTPLRAATAGDAELWCRTMAARIQKLQTVLREERLAEYAAEQEQKRQARAAATTTAAIAAAGAGGSGSSSSGEGGKKTSGVSPRPSPLTSTSPNAVAAANATGSGRTRGFTGAGAGANVGVFSDPLQRPANGTVAGSIPPPPALLQPLREISVTIPHPASLYSPFFAFSALAKAFAPHQTAGTALTRSAALPFPPSSSSSSAATVAAKAAAEAAASTAASATARVAGAHGAALPVSKTIARGVPLRRRAFIGTLPLGSSVAVVLGDGSCVTVSEAVLRGAVGADGGPIGTEDSNRAKSTTSSASGASRSVSAVGAVESESDCSDSDAESQAASTATKSRGAVASGRKNRSAPAAAAGAVYRTRYQQWFPAGDPYDQFSVLLRWERWLPPPPRALRNAAPLLPATVLPLATFAAAVACAFSGGATTAAGTALCLAAVALAAQVLTDKASAASVMAHEYTVTVLAVGARDSQHAAAAAALAEATAAAAAASAGASTGSAADLGRAMGVGLSDAALLAPHNRLRGSVVSPHSLSLSSGGLNGGASSALAPARFNRVASVAEGPLWLSDAETASATASAASAAGYALPDGGGDSGYADDGAVISAAAAATGGLSAAARARPPGATRLPASGVPASQQGLTPITGSSGGGGHMSTSEDTTDAEAAAVAAAERARGRKRTESRAEEHTRIVASLSSIGGFTAPSATTTTTTAPTAAGAGAGAGAVGGKAGKTPAIAEADAYDKEEGESSGTDWAEADHELTSKGELSSKGLDGASSNANAARGHGGQLQPQSLTKGMSFASSSLAAAAAAATGGSPLPCPATLDVRSAADAGALCSGKLRQLGPVHVEKWGGWSEPEHDITQVRGPNYLTDRAKVLSGPPLMRLVHLDQWFHRTSKAPHVAERPDSYAQWWLQQRRLAQPSAESAAAAAAPGTNPDAPYSWSRPPLWVVNFMFPHNGFSNYTCYFEVPGPDGHTSAPWDTKDSPAPAPQPTQPPHPGARALLEKFLNGSDEYRNARLKVIPRLAVGAWLAQRALGSKPGIVGTKITTNYYTDTEGLIFEVDVDVHSSTMAGYVLQVLRNAAKTMVLDLCFAIEAQEADELPEMVVAGARLHYLDLEKTREALD